jgi:hypothetical protein
MIVSHPFLTLLPWIVVLLYNCIWGCFENRKLSRLLPQLLATLSLEIPNILLPPLHRPRSCTARDSLLSFAIRSKRSNHAEDITVLLHQ